MEIVPVLQQAKERLSAIVSEHGLSGETVRVTIGTLSAQQAIGSPGKPNFALTQGKEVMIEAQFKGSFGQAFTSQPQSFLGRLKDVLNMSLDTTNDRAIFIATLNAVTAHLGMVTRTCHCRNEEPEKCGAEIAQHILTKFGRIKVALVGYQPAILDHLSQGLGITNVCCSDLDPKNIGARKFGVEILDGEKENTSLIEWCDLLLVTGSTNVNGTFDELREKWSRKKSV